MSDVKLHANHSSYNNGEFSQKAFESLLNNNPVSSFIYSFNNIPHNIDYITSNFETFINFANSYPGDAEDIAKFIFEECSDFLSKKESKNENYYNKINVSEKYIEDYKSFFNLPYTQDVPVLMLLIPHLKKDISIHVSKFFHDSYNYLFDDFQNNLTNYAIEQANYEPNLSLYNNKIIENLEKEDYEKAFFFANLNSNIYSGTSGYTNIKDEIFYNLPFIKKIKEDYLKDKGSEIYLSTTLSSLFQYLSMTNKEFFPLYLEISSQTVSSSLHELINFKDFSLSSKEENYLAYFKMAYEKIKKDELSYSDYNEENFKKNMMIQRANLVFYAFMISKDLPVKVNSLFGNERLSTVLKSSEFIEKTNASFESSIGSNIIHKDSDFLFHSLLDHKKNVSFSLSFLNSAYDNCVDIINENNRKCQEKNDYSNYLSVPDLNLNFIVHEFNLTLNSILELSLDEPLNFYLSKAYKDNLDVITSSIKDKTACELNYELLINRHDGFLDLVQANGKYSQISDNQIKQADQLIKKYFFRPLNEIELNFSEFSKMKELSFTNFEDISIGSFHYFTGNNLSFKDRYPLTILDQYIELLSYKANEENNSLAGSLLTEYKPYLTNLFEAICHSEIYTNCIYNPENLDKVLPNLTNLKNLILKSGIWTENEQTQILKNIDNSTISLVYYNDPNITSKIFKYASEPYITNFKDKINIFEELFNDIERNIMNSEKNTNQSKNHKPVKKF